MDSVDREKADALFKKMALFAEESKFKDFFKKNKPYYHRCVEAFLEKLKDQDVADLLESYTGIPVEAQYRVLISPALAGPMGHSVSRSGSGTITTVVGAGSGIAEDLPRFYSDIPRRVLYELAHAALDPLVLDHLDRIMETQSCFKPVAARCKRGWRDCFKEQVAAAVANALWRKVPGSERVADEREDAETPYAYAVEKTLGEFEINRGRYPTFADFYPQLFSVFKTCPEPSGGPAPRPQAPHEDWEHQEAVFAARRHYLELREPSRALEIFQSLTRQFPGVIPLWIEQAKVALLAGDSGKALESLKAAENLGPNDPQFHDIALVYQNAKNYSWSLDIFNRLMDRKPANAVYLRDRGICRYLAGEKEGAASDLESSVKLNSRLLSASLALGAVYLDQGKKKEALRLYEQALSQEPAGLEKEEAAARPLLEKGRQEILGPSKQ
jgi:tetratricopeptide (TPR) repeat protein